MTRREHTTRAGCRVVVETVGDALGVTIVQPSDASALYAIHESDARQVAAMLSPVDTAARAYVAARAASLASNDADTLAALIAATDALVAAVGAS